LPDTLKSVSWIFWNTASMECHRKIKMHQDKFSNLNIKLPDPVVAMLKNELENEKKVIQKAIRARINSKPYLKKHGQKLISATSTQVAQHRQQWENGSYGVQVPADARNKMINILKGMESLKEQVEDHERLSRKLGQKMPCDELMIFLLNRVLNAMYRQFWTHREYPAKIGI
jgi:hypothetical protein